MPSQGKNTQRLTLSITRRSTDDLQTNRKYLSFFQISWEPFAEVLFDDHHEQQLLNTSVVERGVFIIDKSMMSYNSISSGSNSSILSVIRSARMRVFKWTKCELFSSDFDRCPVKVCRPSSIWSITLNKCVQERSCRWSEAALGARELSHSVSITRRYRSCAEISRSLGPNALSSTSDSGWSTTCQRSSSLFDRITQR